MADLLDIARTLRERRKTLGWSQHDLAARSGVSRAHIAHFETERLPDIGFSTLTRLLNAVGLDLRLSSLSHQRPTLDDLRSEEEEEEE